MVMAAYDPTGYTILCQFRVELSFKVSKYDDRQYYGAYALGFDFMTEKREVTTTVSLSHRAENHSLSPAR